MTRASLLVVEDDRSLAELLQQELSTAGHDVDVVHTGSDALAAATESDYDLIVLDLNLPDVDGLEVARRVRDQGAGILMLTARAAVESRVDGLYAGASDYMVKPFDVPELLARVHARLRDRRQPTDQIALGSVVIDRERGVCTFEGDPIDLTAREFELLELLGGHPGRIFSKADLEDRLYGPDLPASNTIEVFVSNIRKKLTSAGADPWIETVRGMGYVIRQP